jgi:hypothetical protein
MDTLSLGGVSAERRGTAASLRFGDNKTWRRVALGAILLLAAGLLFYKLDAVETPASLQALVNSGQLRYVYWDANGRGGGGPGFGGGSGSQSSISSWVTSQCTAVQGFNTTTRNQGAPDGTGDASANGQNGGGGFGGQMQVTLYDCATAG